MKFPQRIQGQVPDRIYSFTEDISFLEQLMKEGFNECISLVISDNHLFWIEKGSNETYNKFRLQKRIYGSFHSTGKSKKSVEVKGNYEIKWIDLISNYKYFILNL